jgi:hypothetical protein
MSKVSWKFVIGLPVKRGSIIQLIILEIGNWGKLDLVLLLRFKI